MNDTKTAALVAEVERLTRELHEAEQDAERLLWIERELFDNRWNGVMGPGSARQWSLAGSYRHTVARMIGNTFRAAIDAAMLRTDAGAKTG